jgi:hypothetical protein
MSLIIQSRHALKRRLVATGGVRSMPSTWNNLTMMQVVPSGHSCKNSSAFRSMASSSSSADKDGTNHNNALESTAAAGAWRKKQLKKLETKFTGDPHTSSVIVEEVKEEDDLQPEWKAMESRVTKRKSKTKAEMGGKSGRSNIKITDEEMWLQGGLYDTEVGDDDDGDDGKEGTKS